MSRLVVASVALAMVAAGSATGQSQGESAAPAAAADEAQLRPFDREDVRGVASRITCYCGCPHMQVSSCYCGVADSIREDIAEQLDAGLTPDEIVERFVAEHGAWSLAVPPRRGFNWSIWVLPFALILGGTGVLFLLGRSWTAAAAAGSDQPSGQVAGKGGAPVSAEELSDYEDRVEELVHDED